MKELRRLRILAVIQKHNERVAVRPLFLYGHQMNVANSSQSTLSSSRRILVIEEDFTRRQLLVSMLALRSDLEVFSESADDAAATASLLDVDAVFVDLNATGGSGIELVRRLRRAQPDLTITSIGDDLHPDLHMAAIRAGVRSFLEIPFGRQSLSDTLSEIFGPAVTAA